MLAASASMYWLRLSQFYACIGREFWSSLMVWMLLLVSSSYRGGDAVEWGGGTLPKIRVGA